MSIEVKVSSLRLKSPVMNASGVLEWSPIAAKKLVDAGAGAIVLKSTTREARVGYPQPRIVSVPGGFIVAVGIANPGADTVSTMIKSFKEAVGDTPVIASVAGSSLEEFIEVSSKLEDGGADAIELNLSCPHFKGGGLELGQDPVFVREVTRNVSSIVKIPVIAKLGLTDKVVESALKALEGGAKALTLINTIRAMKIDIYTKKPVLGHKFGGLAGEAIHPVAVRVIYETYKETRADIIGAGGVKDWETAIELILAGAKTVQVGSAILYRGEQVITEIIRGIEKYLWIEGFKNINEIIGLAQRD
ncbi:MAG: dihydroorotate dehydrogenase [Acidilobaceae archaeon]